jgi:hypothetical protein
MLNKRVVGIYIVSALILCFVLTSCDSMVGAVGSNGSNHTTESYHYLNGTKTIGISADAGKIIDVTYTSTVKSGALSLRILDPSKNLAAQLPSGNSGTTEISVGSGGTYQLVITGTKTEGSYDISWSVK